MTFYRMVTNSSNKGESGSRLNETDIYFLTKDDTTETNVDKNLIWICVLTLVATLIICFSVIKLINTNISRWNKYNDRGCSYDVATCVVLEKQWEYISEKDSISKGIQKKIDAKIYDLTKHYFENGTLTNKTKLDKKLRTDPGMFYAVHALHNHSFKDKDRMSENGIPDEEDKLLIVDTDDNEEIQIDSSILSEYRGPPDVGDKPFIVIEIDDKATQTF